MKLIKTLDPTVVQTMTLTLAKAASIHDLPVVLT